MSKKNLLFLIPVIIAVFYWKFKPKIVNPITLVKNKIIEIKKTEPVILNKPAVPATEPGHAKYTLAEPTFDFKYTGMCRYFTKDGVPLISRSAYLHLVKSKKNYILLPKKDAECLAEFSHEFNIVDYYRRLDTAHGFLGKINLQFSEKTNIPGGKLSSQFNPLELKKYGFKNLKHLVKYLSKMTPDVDTDLISFKVKKLSQVILPESTAIQGFVPGVNFVNDSQLQKAFSDKKSAFFVTYDAKKDLKFKYKNYFKIVKISDKNGVYIDPDYLMQYFSNKFEPGINDINKIYIYEKFENSPSSQALAFYFNAKYRDKQVYIVKENFFNQHSYQYLTPKSVSGFNQITIEQIQKLPKKAILIDTRPYAAKDWQIKRTYLGPVKLVANESVIYQDQTVYGSSSVFKSKEILSQIANIKNQYAGLAATEELRNRQFVIYGENDADFGPIIFYEAMKQLNLKNIYWFRPGIRRLKNNIKLGLVKPKILRNTQKQTQTVMKNENIKYDKNASRKFSIVKKSKNISKSLKLLSRSNSNTYQSPKN